MVVLSDLLKCFFFMCVFLGILFLQAPLAKADMSTHDLQVWMQNNYGSPHSKNVPNLDLQDKKSLTCPLNFELLAKASSDECFYGICDDRNYQTDSFPCLEKNGTQGQPKVNQAYVWGMTVADNGHIWFGTMANTQCLVLSNYLGLTGGFDSPSYVCALDACSGLPFDDWRAPHIYSYNPETGELTEHTPDEQDLGFTLGIRSAGSVGDIIFLGGPAMDNVLGACVKIFAYKQDGTYLGSSLIQDAIDSSGDLQGTNIRKWITVNDHLYTTIGSNQGGRVLKWTGNAEDPFHFTVVGILDGGSGAELAFHDGRIFVTTWPGFELAGGQSEAKLFMSPKVNEQLTAADKGGWLDVWTVSDYEPDAITAGTYGGGALASFDGYLYWGTMHVPFMSFGAYAQVYKNLTREESIKAFLGSYRAISIFRGQDFGTDQEKIELLYGLPKLPVSKEENGTLTWSLQPNNMEKKAPLFGLSGFGNMFNNYSWSMQVFDQKLWMGTMDWSYLAGDLLQPPFRNFLQDELNATLPEELPVGADFWYGADLFCMPSAERPAFPVSMSGLGNYLNYGVRNMEVSHDMLYFGMANPMNLMTDLTDDRPEGGWELRSRGALEVDGDLVPADIEDLAPNNGDGNGDGRRDSEQSFVVSAPGPGGQGFLTVEVLEHEAKGVCGQIRGMTPVAQGTLPRDDGYAFPAGAMSILLQCSGMESGQATLRIYYHGLSDLEGFVYRKFGQTDLESTPQWFTFPYVDFGMAHIGGTEVPYAQLILTDNALGDFLRSAQNGDGFILDPGGPAKREPEKNVPVPTLSQWGMIGTSLLLMGMAVLFLREQRKKRVG